MFHWRKRLSEWRAVVRQYGRGHYMGMVVALLSGPVPTDTWRERMKICLRCPVLDRERMICRKELGDGRVLGCSCYTPLLALTAAPYKRGCYAREITEHEGWPSYVFKSRRAKLRAVWRFIFPRGRQTCRGNRNEYSWHLEI